MFKRIEEELTHKELSSYSFKDIASIVDGKNIFSPVSVNKNDAAEDTLVAYSSKTCYDFYMNRLQVHVTNTDDLFCVEVFLCSADHAWGDGASSAEADKFKVYTNCIQRIMTGRFVDDEIYISGSWNRYVRENFKKITQCIEGCKECVKFDTIFKAIA